MSQLTPIATYNLALKPFQPLPAIEEDFPVTIRLTLASLDPEAEDDKAEPSTLRILKKAAFDEDEEDEEDDYDEEDEEDELDEEEEVTVKSNGSKNDIEVDEKVEEDDEDEEEEDDEEESDGDDEDDLDDDIAEFVVCTLSPKHQYQQTLDLTITPDEEVYFVVTGSYPIHLTGNYIEHPADESDEDEEEYGEYDDEYDLSPDEDEIIHGIDFNEAYDEDEDDEDDEDDEYDREESAEPGKIQEIKDEEEAKANGEQTNKKRAASEEESKKSKKAKKNAAKKEEKKSVQFSEELEQGPTGSTLAKDKKEKKSAESDKASKDKKYPTKTLLGGVITEDRKVGSGPTAKSGNKVGIRYIGKLKNGKVFDKNTSGKPFSFKLGKGECIKGFDLGVTGMSVGGERRVIIPAKMGYGSQALPGIPANSELTFDIKLVSLK
ncbi:peptidyl-prolyl cis-trans isomerase [Candida orthopsilosis Co 90-125]|uniref:FK506-binding protein n=1 Tax=Candida orthopsilosis (strain 90-125) TaxID=1136231 RepID=H8X2C0_CANO9|nr:peptidyl-prolyl cis-trans isomerase [Candida orthopsilosis Co 90-125]CCG22842.1 peptidyl-prolyl cis-trans isomerase [Candida orthopsilosis Co 90-125]